MFFLEDAKWDPEYLTYMRKSGVAWNEEFQRWDEEFEETPFPSIPHTFWWVLVTATSVGYGDHYPKSLPGKLCASLMMVISLCVLALPIGVIGSNFEKVWAEFDGEKKQEQT